MKVFDKIHAGVWKINLLSPCSYSRNDQIKKLIGWQVEHLPEVSPLKWDNFVPLGHPFDPQNFAESIPDQIHPGALFWERNRKPKAHGTWRAGVAPNHPNPLAITRHSNSTARGMEHTLQPALTRFMQTMPPLMPCDIGFIEWESDLYIDIEGQSSFGGYLLTTHTLRHWLPDMLWGMVFGPPYVRMFGLQKLLSCPAHSIVQLAPESVYIQLTEDLRDNELRFEHLQAKRMEAKLHLGIEHFWQPEKTYDWREHPENAGKVFKVPEFELWPDPPIEMGQKLQNWFQKLRKD
jgi:hypothetical protein